MLTLLNCIFAICIIAIILCLILLCVGLYLELQPHFPRIRRIINKLLLFFALTYMFCSVGARIWPSFFGDNAHLITVSAIFSFAVFFVTFGIGTKQELKNKVKVILRGIRLFSVFYFIFDTIFIYNPSLMSQINGWLSSFYNLNSLTIGLYKYFPWCILSAIYSVSFVILVSNSKIVYKKLVTFLTKAEIQGT